MLFILCMAVCDFWTNIMDATIVLAQVRQTSQISRMCINLHTCSPRKQTQQCLFESSCSHIACVYTHTHALYVHLPPSQISMFAHRPSHSHREYIQYRIWPLASQESQPCQTHMSWYCPDITTNQLIRHVDAECRRLCSSLSVAKKHKSMIVNSSNTILTKTVFGKHVCIIGQ